MFGVHFRACLACTICEAGFAEATYGVHVQKGPSGLLANMCTLVRGALDWSALSGQLTRACLPTCEEEEEAGEGELPLFIWRRRRGSRLSCTSVNDPINKPGPGASKRPALRVCVCVCVCECVCDCTMTPLTLLRFIQTL